MSNVKEQLEADIIRFFENIENQSQNDKRKTLRDLMDKYIHLSSSDYLMDSYDLNSIIGAAKNKMATEKVTRFLKSGMMVRKISQGEISNLLVIESTISHLNKIGCLKKLPKFDYKEDKY